LDDVLVGERPRDRAAAGTLFDGHHDLSRAGAGVVVGLEEALHHGAQRLVGDGHSATDDGDCEQDDENAAEDRRLALACAALVALLCGKLGLAHFAARRRCRCIRLDRVERVLVVAEDGCFEMVVHRRRSFFLLPPGTTVSPGGLPDWTSVSRAVCRMSTAAA